MLGKVQWLASYQEMGLRTRAKQQVRELGSAQAGRMTFFLEPGGMEVQADRGLLFHSVVCLQTMGLKGAILLQLPW